MSNHFCDLIYVPLQRCTVDHPERARQKISPTRTGPPPSATSPRSTSSAGRLLPHCGAPPRPHPSSSPRPPVHPSPSRVRVSVSRQMVKIRETMPRFLDRWGDINRRTREPQHLVCLRISVEVFRYPNALAQRLRSYIGTIRHSPVSGDNFSKTTSWPNGV